MYPCKWIGSVDPSDLTGTAIFTVDGEEFALALESFAQFRAVDRMLDLANRQGKAFASRDLDYVVRRALRDRIAQIAPEVV